MSEVERIAGWYVQVAVRPGALSDNVYENDPLKQQRLCAQCVSRGKWGNYAWLMNRARQHGKYRVLALCAQHREPRDVVERWLTLLAAQATLGRLAL